MEQQQLTWFARNKKTILITGAVITVIGIAYLLLRDKGETKSSDKKDGSKDDTNAQLKDEKVTTPEPTPASTPESKPKPTDPTLPYSGVGCSDIRTNFDRDYDYVKCNDEWFAKSKENPASKIISLKVWTSLKSNTVSTDRLNRRYPN